MNKFIAVDYVNGLFSKVIKEFHDDKLEKNWILCAQRK